MRQIAEVPRWHTSIPVRHAHVALWALVGGQQAPGSPDLLLASETIGRVIGEWEAWRRSPFSELDYCPFCYVTWVAREHPTDHLPYCLAHPSFTRLRAAQVATDLAPGFEPQLRLWPPDVAVCPEADRAKFYFARTLAERPRRPHVAYRYDAEQALTLLADPIGRLQASPGSAEAIAVLREVVSQWDHIYWRQTDPCPFCEAPFELAEQQRHFLICPRHPVTADAVTTERLLEQALGSDTAYRLLALTRHVESTRDMIRALLNSCRAYEDEMGWSEGAAYSEAWFERPWRAACAAAGALLEKRTPSSHLSLPWCYAGVRSPVQALQEEAARLSEALTRLHLACNRFWNGMGDDGRHSVIHDRLFPPWRDAQSAARLALQPRATPGVE